MIAWSLTNAINRLYEVSLAHYAGKKSFSFEPKSIDDFIPDYLGITKAPTPPRDPQQKAEFAIFAEQLAASNKRNP